MNVLRLLVDAWARSIIIGLKWYTYPIVRIDTMSESEQGIPEIPIFLEAR